MMHHSKPQGEACSLLYGTTGYGKMSMLQTYILLPNPRQTKMSC